MSFDLNNFQSDWNSSSHFGAFEKFFGAREKIQVGLSDRDSKITIKVIAESAFCALMDKCGLSEFAEVFLNVKPEVILEKDKQLDQEFITTKEWKDLSKATIIKDLNKSNLPHSHLDKFATLIASLAADVYDNRLAEQSSLPSSENTFSKMPSTSTHQTPTQAKTTDVFSNSVPQQELKPSPSTTTHNVAQPILSPAPPSNEPEIVKQPVADIVKQPVADTAKDPSLTATPQSPPETSTEKLEKQQTILDNLEKQTTNPTIKQRIEELQSEIINLKEPSSEEYSDHSSEETKSPESPVATEKTQLPSSANLERFLLKVNSNINRTSPLMPADKKDLKDKIQAIIDSKDSNYKTTIENLLKQYKVPIPQESIPQAKSSELNDNTAQTASQQQSIVPDAKTSSFQRPRRIGIRPPTAPKLKSSISVDVASLPPKPEGWIRPGLFEVRKNEMRKETIEKIEQKVTLLQQEVALLQLEVLVSPTPKDQSLTTQNFKELLVNTLMHKVKESSDGTTTITVNKQEEAFLKALSKVFEKAKTDFPEYTQQLEREERSFNRNLGTVLKDALNYKNQSNFEARFALEMTPVVDQLLQGIITINDFYQKADSALRPSSQTALIQTVDTPLYRILEDLQSPLENSKEKNATKERQIQNTPVYSRLVEDINYWAEGGANSLPTLDQFNDIIDVISQNPSITPNLRAQLLLMKADIEAINEGLNVSQRNPKDLTDSISALLTHYSPVLNEALNLQRSLPLQALEAPPTPEEKKLSALTSKINEAMHTILNYDFTGTVSNSHTNEIIDKFIKVRNELDNLKKTYKPSWIPFTPTKNIEDLSPNELQSYQAHVDKRTKQIEKAVSQDIEDIQDFMAAQAQFKAAANSIYEKISNLENFTGKKPQFTIAASLKELVHRKHDEIQLKEDFHSEFLIEEPLPILTEKIEKTIKSLNEETDKILENEADINLKEQFKSFAPDSLEAEKIREAYVNKMEAEKDKAKNDRQEILENLNRSVKIATDPQDFAYLNIFDPQSIQQTLTKIDKQTENAINQIPRPDEDNANIEDLQAYRDAVRHEITKGHQELSFSKRAFEHVVESYKKFNKEVAAYPEVEDPILANLLSTRLQEAKDAQTAFLGDEGINSQQKAIDFANLVNQHLKELDSIRLKWQFLSPLEQLETKNLSDEHKTTLTSKIYTDLQKQVDELKETNQELFALIDDPAVSKYLPKPLADNLRQSIEAKVNNPVQLAPPDNPSMDQIHQDVKIVEAEIAATNQLENDIDLRKFAETAREHEAAMELAKKTVEDLRSREIPQHSSADNLQRVIDRITTARDADMQTKDTKQALEEYIDKLKATNLKLEMEQISAITANSTLSEQLSKLTVGTTAYNEVLAATIAPQLMALENVSSIITEAKDRLEEMQQHGFKFAEEWVEDFNDNIDPTLMKSLKSLTDRYDSGWLLSNPTPLNQITPSDVSGYQKKVAEITKKISSQTANKIEELNTIYQGWQSYKNELYATFEAKGELESQIIELQAKAYRGAAEASDEEQITKLTLALNTLEEQLQTIQDRHQLAAANSIFEPIHGLPNLHANARTYRDTAYKLEEALKEAVADIEN